MSKNDQTSAPAGNPYIGSIAEIVCSGERGQIIGVAYYATQQPRALIRYKSADGLARESWWGFDAITIDPAPAIA